MRNPKPRRIVPSPKPNMFSSVDDLMPKQPEDIEKVSGIRQKLSRITNSQASLFYEVESLIKESESRIIQKSEDEEIIDVINESLSFLEDFMSNQTDMNDFLKSAYSVMSSLNTKLGQDERGNGTIRSVDEF